MNGILSRSELRAAARESLFGNWGKSIAVFLIYVAITISLGFIPFFGQLVLILITGVFTLGMALYFIRLARGEDPSVSSLFEGFERFVKVFLLTLLMGIFTLLWSLLFIIPGIIAGYRYSQAYYILIDNPDISALEAIRRSKEMMAGHKWRYFVLQLSFIGWYLLCMLTLGIGALWLAPYMAATNAHFYENLRHCNGSFGIAPPPDSLGIYPS
ncbi:DUF975 family protein [Paenibacillus sp. HB172176]|uniref:DUF975 family protein n=1 Tax=Paenibacillus sp. HB172176 TaxID=2493690 RepID=UPI00143B6EBB|nr:DUF975 family protein [Paenibacillus sp. HB172176]